VWKIESDQHGNPILKTKLKADDSHYCSSKYTTFIAKMKYLWTYSTKLNILLKEFTYSYVPEEMIIDEIENSYQPKDLLNYVYLKYR